MTAGSTVVVTHAHPDDEAIFTGSTMIRMARRGWRVVLVAATGGEQGRPLVRLAPGETMQHRRQRELEQSCAVLGVQRLVILGYLDSGAGRGARYAAGSLGRATAGQVSRRLADVVEQENASALVHYDSGGIYGHVDHVRVHQAGARVARRLGIPAYEATVDPVRLNRKRRHVLHAAAYPGTPLGVSPDRITLTLHADRAELAGKRAAMAAHASQVNLDHLDRRAFARTYGQEWFVRTGPAGPLDALEGAPFTTRRRRASRS